MVAQLGAKIDWDWIDREIAPLYSAKGRPGIESVETRLAVGECAHRAGSSPDLLHDALEWIVGADLLPVDVRKCVIG